MESKVNSHQLNLGDALVKTWDIFVANLQSLGTITMLIFIPVYAFQELVLNYFLGVPSFGSQGDMFSGPEPLNFTNFNEIGTFVWITILVALVGFVANTLLAIITAHVTKNSLEGKEVLSADKAFMDMLPRWGGALWTVILMYILLIPLFLAFIIPGVIFAVYWMFASVVVATTGLYGWKALERSRLAVRGNWWRVLGYTLVFSLMIGIIALFFSFLASLMPMNIVSIIVLNTLMTFISTSILVFFTVVFTSLESICKYNARKDLPEAPVPAEENNPLQTT